jgi:aspartate/methionine/tyrosine aminotransferase
MTQAARHLAAHRLDDVSLSGIREVYEALTAWAAAAPGRHPIPFHFGMPDFDTPAHIKQALYDAVAAGFVKYTGSRGIPDLLEALARKLYRENGITADPARHLVVTCGANEAIGATILALVDPGDEVIIPDPAWPHYEQCIRIAGAQPIPCPLDRDRGFTLTANAISRLITPRTRMIIINSPNNPTGAVMPRADVEAVAALARDRGVWLMSDEAYERLVFDGEHVSPGALPGLADTVITIGCLSKTYAMTGWRLGYLCAPERAADAINRVHLYTVSCAVSFVQKAAIAAFDGDQTPVSQMLAAYRRRRDLIVDLLRAIPGVDVQTPAGAFYVFPNIERFGIPSRELALRLVEDAGVGAVHGSAFGAAGEGFLRLAYACSEDDIREGVGRMAQVLSRLTPATARAPRPPQERHAR